MAFRTSKAPGRFFPADKDALAALMAEYAQKTAPLRMAYPAAPRAVIAPHAGYGFSGGLAAGAWALTARAQPDRIAILSPSHGLAFDGIAVPTGHGAVALPGKRVKIGKRACQALIRARCAIGLDAAFDNEHGIDAHLPFARFLHPKATVVPIVIGAATEGQVAAVIDRLEKLEGKTLYVLSSDLSHFLTHEQAQRIDTQTAGLIETGQGARLTPAHACGARAISGWFASRLGARCRPLRIGQGTSFDVTKDAGRVVGYGTWGLFDPGDDILPDAVKQELLRVARQALQSRLARGVMPQIDLGSFPVPMRSLMASFVTLTLRGRLRGCIGSFSAHRPLVTDVATNAAKAGFGDTRFKPLDAQELSQVAIEVCVLTRPSALDEGSETALLDALRPGQSGLILTEGTKRAVFLPSVWRALPEPADFVRALKQKAGIDPDHWGPEMQASLFRTEAFGEADVAEAKAA